LSPDISDGSSILDAKKWSLPQRAATAEESDQQGVHIAVVPILPVANPSDSR
jgi:hypothetical protein